MRHYNNPIFRQLKDLKKGLYVKQQIYIDEDDIHKWLKLRIDEAQNLMASIEKLIDHLNYAWGKSGEKGDVNEINHIASLIRDHLEQIARYEKKVYFTSAPDKYKKLIQLFKDIMSSMAEKIEYVPEFLDEVTSEINSDHGGTVENPHIMKKTITFELPKNWSKKFNQEINLINRSGDSQPKSVLDSFIIGLVNFIAIIFVLIIFVAIFT